MAEWLRSGLQNRLPRFNSGRGLQQNQQVSDGLKLARISRQCFVSKFPLRRFPPPWTVEDIGATYVVRTLSGQALAYVYFEEEPGRRSAAKLPTKDEARAYFAAIDFSISSYAGIRGSEE